MRCLKQRHRRNFGGLLNKDELEAAQKYRDGRQEVKIGADDKGAEPVVVVGDQYPAMDTISSTDLKVEGKLFKPLK